MKFDAVIITLVAAAAQAAAVREHSYPEGNPVFHKGVGHAGVPGSPAAHAKRAAEAVISAIHAAPTTSKSGANYFCGIDDTKCASKEQALDRINIAAHKVFNGIHAREALADADAEPSARRGGFVSFCGAPGTSCQEKRDALAKKKAKAAHGGFVSFCGAPGTSCQEKREAEPEAMAFPRKGGGLVSFCGTKGTSCQEKRSAEPRRGGYVSFCGAPGTSCQEKREVKAVQDAITKFNPNVEKEECHADGEACDAITKAHKAFKEVSRREAEAAKETSPTAKLAWCGSEDCSEVAKEHLKAAAAGKPEAKKAEEECYGPEGHCTLAARDLAELESALDEGVNAVLAF